MRKHLLSGLVFLFLILRLTTLLTAVESVSWWEELYRGTIAKELIEGLKIPFWEYQADEYSGGSLATGILAAPLFLLLGPNLFALKLVPLLFSLASLVLLFVFLRRHFGEKPAVIACSLLIFAPFRMVTLSLVAMGFHTESVFFSIAMVFCLYEFLFGTGKKILFAALFGLAGGIGFSFTYVTAVTLLVCLLTWFLVDRNSFFGKPMLAFFSGLFAGLSPSLLYNATHDFAGLHFLFDLFSVRDGADISPLAKIAGIPVQILRILLSSFPSLFSFYPRTGWIAILLADLTYALLLASLFAFYWREKREPSKKALFFLLYPLIYIFIYASIRYGVPVRMEATFVPFRYLFPFCFMAAVPVAIALSRPRWGKPVWILLLALGFASQTPLFFNERFGRAFHYKGYSYSDTGWIWGEYFNPIRTRIGAFAKAAGLLNEEDRRYLYWGLANTFEPMSVDRDPLEVLQWIEREIPAPYRHYFIEFLGMTVEEGETEVAMQIAEQYRDRFFRGQTFQKAFHVSTPSAFLDLAEKMEPDQRRFLFIDLGRMMYHTTYLRGEEQRRIQNRATQILQGLEAEEKIPVWRGIGKWAGSDAFNDIRTEKTFRQIRTFFPPESQGDIFWGIGWGIGKISREDSIRALDRIRRLPAQAQPAAMEGFTAFKKWDRNLPF